jgi:signal transduction histidine kinase
MTAWEFLRDRQAQLLQHLVSLSAMTGFLRRTGTASGVLVIVAVVWAMGLALTLAVRYLHVNARLKELSSLMNALDKKYLFTECAPKPRDIYGRRLFELTKRAGKSMIEAVSNAKSSQKEYCEYIESWVHEIKAPITAAGLVCQNNKSELTRRLAGLLAQVEHHVERALYYARAGNVEKDFIVRETPLAEIVRETVAKNQILLIQSGVRVETGNLDAAVYTDGKWVTFMLGQLISNAIRYKRGNPVIHFAAERNGDRICLTVGDNGVGIPAYDLPRVFERGFTGSNGRAVGTSTGMGLYIVKRLADFLQIELAVTSVPGENTAVSLTFPAKLTKL